ncbi:hypothetical protein HBH70_167450 [Parastagonospora nodorum]|nr:hypothetical protein HBH52_002530 [Parastagonospora nodorum]KAH4044104.1 hypothetical protein HBH49_220150 [Parastagonospora nodorum]KAH4205643.1 hypothetical protein HBI95_129490 [Parastagonospora nodorum]KAH4265380.1 hypothetical protein HBI03_083800 [Parastagonospora nodorum]KAH4283372.1 hypothetical protein HBI04_022210 [Parastagonospora nodorum]
MRIEEEWITINYRLCRTKGLESLCGEKLPRWFVEAGLEDVQIKRYMLPMGQWEGMTEAERKFGEHYPIGIGASMLVSMRKLGQGQNEVSQEDIEKGVEGANKVKQEWQKYRGFFWVYAVCGRKPVR